VFDEIARQIGWVVIGFAIFYMAGKFIISHSDANNRKNELQLSIWDHQRRLAFRNIWRSSNDSRVIQKVKMAYGPWALLDIELSDKEYDLKMQQSEDCHAYYAAVKQIQESGFPYILENGEIIATFTEEYKNRPSTNKMPQVDSTSEITTLSSAASIKMPWNEVVSDVRIEANRNHIFPPPQIDQYNQRGLDEYILQEIEKISPWLEREMTPSEIAESGYAEMARTNEEKFWFYRSPPESWAALAGEAGIAIVKDGKIILHFQTIIS
jgi:hypothetical protein